MGAASEKNAKVSPEELSVRRRSCCPYRVDVILYVLVASVLIYILIQVDIAGVMYQGLSAIWSRLSKDLSIG